MRRRNDWPKRLADEVAFRDSHPFTLGLHDCCAASWALIRAMTGKDVGQPYRGYTGLFTARAALDEHGGVHAVAVAIAKDNGLKQCKPVMAGRGDLVLTDDAEDCGLGTVAMGIVDFNGRDILVAGHIGWERRPLQQATHAWHV